MVEVQRPAAIRSANWATPTPAPGALGLVTAALIGGIAALSWSLAAWTTAGTPAPVSINDERATAPPGAGSPALKKLPQDDGRNLP
jgi:hypothetical protein